MESACNKRVLAALVACVALLPAASSPAADAAMQPVRVCEVLETPDAYDGKALALLGRFSFREDGRFIGEESCGKELKTGSAILRLSEDSKSAPRPDGALQIDAAALDRKLAAVRERTALRKYPFGSPQYDRWAVVYGRFEAGKQNEGAARPAPHTLLYRGDGVILFIHDR